MPHDKRLSQICRAHCVQCGNNVTTTKYGDKVSATVSNGIDWSDSANGMDSLLKYHHSAIFTILLNA